jgi:hypothetical protein
LHADQRIVRSRKAANHHLIRVKSPHLRRKGQSETAKCKDRIQALLREIAIQRDGGCVLRHYPEEGVDPRGPPLVSDLVPLLWFYEVRNGLLMAHRASESPSIKLTVPHAHEGASNRRRPGQTFRNSRTARPHAIPTASGSVSALIGERCGVTVISAEKPRGA